MIDIDLYMLVQDSNTHTLADCAVYHQYHHFFTLYLSEKENQLFIVERTKPSMRQVSWEDFLELTAKEIDNPKIKYFIEQYKAIQQKFDLENNLINPQQTNKSTLKL